MHNGAYTTLRGAVVHHLDRQRGLRDYDRDQLSEEFRDQVHRSDEVIEDVAETVSDHAVPLRELTDQEVDDLVVFLHALSAPGADDLSRWVPEDVPSGLAVGGALTP